MIYSISHELVCFYLTPMYPFHKKEWVPHWVHTGHLYIRGMKMSKSLKNFKLYGIFYHRLTKMATPNHNHYLPLIHLLTTFDYGVWDYPVRIEGLLHVLRPESRKQRCVFIELFIFLSSYIFDMI